jgi:baseplate J-like protein
MIYDCCDRIRRDLVAANNKKGGAVQINGIDYLEVLDHDAPANSPPQRTLLVHLLLKVPALGVDNVKIEGGARVRDVHASWVAPADNPPPAVVDPERSSFTSLADAPQTLLVRTDSNGDHSIYTLRLVNSVQNADDSPPNGFDPRLCEVQFSFKVECPTPFDCAPENVCPAPDRALPQINYLAKDYSGFRTLILDRLAQLLPAWTATSVADMGVTLAELLAYVGDYLSYQQDAVATEAYLNTARKRVSLRRHALLVDYRVSDGCNARTWLQVLVNGDAVPLAQQGTRFYTRVPGLPAVLSPGSRELQLAEESDAKVFEPMVDATLYQAHNAMKFYAWGDGRCCLPVGAVAATLAGHFPNLKAGDVLVFQEVVGPNTGDAADADPKHRCAVRLSRVVAFDASNNPLTDPLPNPDGSLNQITDIEWQGADALPFPICVSSLSDRDHGSKPVSDVSIALGNIVPADHGRTITGESLGPVPEPGMYFGADPGASRCDAPAPVAVPVRYRPLLQRSPLTHAGPLQIVVDPIAKKRIDPGISAEAAMRWSLDAVLPAISLHESLGAQQIDWSPQADLLESSAVANDFVVETEFDGTTRLRFGDGVNGRRPTSGAQFSADYRVGNGTAGNIGAQALFHILALDARITGIVNPLPAAGGCDMESAEQIRRRAPRAYRTQKRCVTAADYQDRAGGYPGVQRAAATFRWTGSWHTVFATVDPVGGGAPSPDLESGLERYLESYRMAGYDLQLEAPLYVSLEIGLLVCVSQDYFRSDVEAALLSALGSRRLPDGSRGLFYPDNFSFGQTVYLSPIYARARGVEGVASVQITKFQRQGLNDIQYLTRGEMPLGRLEIARLDNDPNFPENGILELQMCGGK